MTSAELVAQADMLAYLSQYMDFSEKNGELWALSCFTKEKTPSFSLDPDRGVWWDFSSGQGGNLVEFILLHDKCSVGEALRKIAAFSGVNLNSDSQIRQRLSATGVAKRFRERERKQNASTAHILPDDWMSHYERRLDKLQLWMDEGISLEVLDRFQVRYDPLDDRIVYPLRNERGEIFCVSGRTCDPEWKEKGLRKYTYTSSIGSQPTIGCLWEHSAEVRRSRELIIVEGIKSVLKLETWGIRNGGCLYTSHLSSPQFDILVKLAGWHGVRMVFALDSDVDITKDQRIVRLARFARVEWVKNHDGLIGDKMSPVDAGQEIWENLYSRRTEVMAPSRI